MLFRGSCETNLGSLTLERTRGAAAQADLSRLREEEIRIRIASALDTSPDEVTIDHWKIGCECRLSIHCRGSHGPRRFFAKIFIVDPYPLVPHFPLPWEEVIPLREQVRFRPIKDQIEAEGNGTREARRLAGPALVPSELGRSREARTIVWQEVGGKRLDHMMRVSGWNARQGKACVQAMHQAGAWLRRLHDGSGQRSEILDFAQTIDLIPLLVKQHGSSSPRYTEMACRVVETAFEMVGRQTRVPLPWGLCHGDFSLPNLIWDAKLKRLSVIDFEHSGSGTTFHDLFALAFDFRRQLLNPFIPRDLIESCERSFWAGYGPIPRETWILATGLALARIFYYSLPRLATRSKRRGWLAGVTASTYRVLFEDVVLKKRLQPLTSLALTS